MGTQAERKKLTKTLRRLREAGTDWGTLSQMFKDAQNEVFEEECKRAELARQQLSFDLS